VMQSISANLTSALSAGVLSPKTRIVMHLSNNRTGSPTVTADNEKNKIAIVDGWYVPSMKFARTDSEYLTDDWARVWPMDVSTNTKVPWTSSSNPPTTITVDYGQPVNCNKILISTDPFVDRATQITVQIDKGSGFQTIANNYSPSGYLTELYLQSSDGNTWSDTVNRNYLTQIYKVRLTISATASGYPVQVYEIDAMIEADISDDVLSWTINKDRDISSQTASPIGMSNANSASITLDNSSNKYNNESSQSPYKDMLYPNVRFDIWLGFKLPDSSYEYVKQGVFYADSWDMSNDTSQVSVSCRDGSKFLQDYKVTPILYEDWLISDIIRDITERSGIRDKAIDTSLSLDITRPEGDHADIIDVEDTVCIPKRHTVWTVDDQTYWQFLQEIALADLGSFYFDETGTFVFQTKEWMKKTTVNLTLDQDVHIISAKHRNEIVKNSFSIEYTIPKVTDHSVGLWEADDPTILDATTLGGSITANDTVIPAGDISDWPKKGYIKIDDEIIRYDNRTDSSFYNCARGELHTDPASHSGGKTIYEIRKFEVEFSQAPATDIAVLSTNEVYTDIIATNFGPFKGEFYLLNNNSGLTIVEGAHVEAALDGLPEFLIIYGRAIDDQEPQTINIRDDASIRRWGEQEFVMSLPWVQSEIHAKTLADFMVDVFKKPVVFVDAEVFAIPHLQIGDIVKINYPRLGVQSKDFHVVGITISGGLPAISQSLRLRSVTA